ncbi:MAG: N-acetylmuramoyl-L-alanine amidase [Parvicellaceae bacterium]|jgi:N-acetylmuramoyl-L-alanine amidase
MKKLTIILSSLFCFCIASASAGIGSSDATPPFPKKSVTIIIDAGHGGHDPGNLNGSTGMKLEKDLNLEIAKKLGDYLQEFLPNQVKVIYTRNSDQFIALENRVSVGNSKKADYFISVHCNSSVKPDVCGTETHVHNADSKVARELATQIQNQFANRAGRVDRKVKIKHDRGYNLLVLKDSKMPAVLVECGFMTNSTEEVYLNSDKGQSLIASAIFRAFRDYIKVRHGITQKDPNEVTKPAGPVYKIQIMASQTPVSLEMPDFKIVGEEIEEIKLEGTTFNYKYYVGTFENKKEAKKMLKKVKESPFTDAFVVRFE